MGQPRETRNSLARHLGMRVLHFAELTSTNDFTAGLAADPANVGVVVAADHQTRGRGQYGRTWQSGPGASLLFSVLLFPTAGLRRPALLTAWAAVAVAGAIRELAGADARIKWPNDLLLGGKKVCGILIEQGGGTVVGIGLNLNQSAAELVDAGLSDATSLAAVSGSTFDPSHALAVVLRQLDEEYDRLTRGDFAGLEARWAAGVGLVGDPATLELADGTCRTGRLLQLGFDGVAIAGEGGEVLRFSPESVRRVRG